MVLKGAARLTVVVALALALVARSSAQQQTSTLITNASVLDGTGAPATRVSVRISDDRIFEVGALEPSADDTVVDARGLTLAPGFIDTHSHHDRGLADALAPLSQGITTIVVGQDGGSSVPLEDLFARFEADPAWGQRRVLRGPWDAASSGHGRRLPPGGDGRRDQQDGRSSS